MSGGGTESAIQAHSFRDRSSQLFGQTWVGVVWKFLVSSGGLSDMSVLASSTAHLTQPSGSSTDIFLSLCSKQRPCYSCPACLSPVSWFWLNGSLITVLLKWKAKCLTWTPPFPLSPPPYLPVYFRTAPPPQRDLSFLFCSLQLLSMGVPPSFLPGTLSLAIFSPCYLSS